MGHRAKQHVDLKSPILSVFPFVIMFNLYLNYVFLYLKLRKKFLKTGLGGEKITISQLLSTSKFCNFVSCPKITRIYILYKAECRYFLVEGDGGSQL